MYTAETQKRRVRLVAASEENSFGRSVPVRKDIAKLIAAETSRGLGNFPSVLPNLDEQEGAGYQSAHGQHIADW